MISAKWIWKAQESYQLYNQTLIARKRFTIRDVSEAVVSLTADSYYRLYINGEWVNDGPCRSWPEHYQYDVIEITGYLRPGENEIKVIARYWGTGTFHTRPQQSGLLAQVEIKQADGSRLVIGSDETWEVAESTAWQPNTPKVSIQMEPQEVYDARVEDHLEFEPAKVLYPANEAPWKDLHARDSALLTRQPFAPKTFLGANLVKRSPDMHLCIPAARLAHPGLVEANHSLSMAGGLATVMHLSQPEEVAFWESGVSVTVDGLHSETGRYALKKGEHFILLFISEVLGHYKEKELIISNPQNSLRLENPLNPAEKNPWCYIPFPEYAYADDDMRWQTFGPRPERLPVLQAYQKEVERLSFSIKDCLTFRSILGDRVQQLSVEDLFVTDSHRLFMNRQVVGDAAACVKNGPALMHDNEEVTIIQPHPSADIELVYDLGEQNIGYFEFQLLAPEGVVIDIYGVEYITPDGVIQHTEGNRNGLRYITRSGLNRFTSTKRRSGRYLFVTLRSQIGPVSIRKIQLIESTYPVNAVGSFRCSDARLENIWEISARTLKLCMEDSFTDCPLYEQTLWVGDARNESVYAYPVYGSLDIGRRCIRLAAQSLERYPITGCQVPSTWDCLLPAWSFLWGISIWDYYAFSGDLEFLRELWPSAVRNLQGAEQYLDKNGLFSGPFWNMFDWSGIDDKHETVLHNSLLLVGAIDAAQKCAGVLGDEVKAVWLADFRSHLSASINHFWDPTRHSYPDSIYADGAISQSLSQHTSFLALLYDVIPPDQAAYALSNVLNPPEGMVPVGSPFAMMYYYEALDKSGQKDEIIRSIYSSYLPMLESGATTVWEVFSASKDRPGGFPTRSHCHAWSAAPLYFLNRILLGIHQVGIGGSVFEISPRLNGLEWATGSVATNNGPLSVSWHLKNKTLYVKVRIPEGTAVKFVENETHQGLTIQME